MRRDPGKSAGTEMNATVFDYPFDCVRVVT